MPRTWRSRREPIRCPAVHHSPTAVTSGQSAVSAATTRSCRPNEPPPRPTPSEATATSRTPPAGQATRGAGRGARRRRPRAPATPRGGRTRRATAVCRAEDSSREGSGTSATPEGRQPAGARATRPARRADPRAPGGDDVRQPGDDERRGHHPAVRGREGGERADRLGARVEAAADEVGGPGPPADEGQRVATAR